MVMSILLASVLIASYFHCILMVYIIKYIAFKTRRFWKLLQIIFWKVCENNFHNARATAASMLCLWKCVG